MDHGAAPSFIGAGGLVVALRGLDFDLDDGRSPLADFVVTGPADICVDVTRGDKPMREWGRSETLDWQVDEAQRTVDLHLTEYKARFDLTGRRARVHFEGPWPRAVESFLKSAVQLFALEVRAGLVLHSSSVIAGEKAVVFTGRASAGKSTAAALSQETGRMMMSEEMTFVGRLDEDGAVLASPLPAWQKSGVKPRPVAVPLRAIYALEQAQEDRVEEIPRGEQVRRLAVAASIGVRHRLFMERALDLAEQLVERVPVHVLHFRKSPAFWDVIEPGGGAD